MDLLEEKYLNILNQHYKNIIKNKYNKYYNQVISITHITGIHLDFYNKPYIFLNKKNPDLIFRNAVLKKINTLNKLMYKDIFIPKDSIEIMIKQCNYATSNKDYWIRFGYTNEQFTVISETYNLLIQFLKDYLIYLQLNHTKFNNSVLGLGKTENGEKLYQFILETNSGFDKISPEYIQNLAILCLKNTLNQIKNHTKLPYTDAIQKYKKNLKFFDSEKDFMSSAKYNIIKLRNISENLFHDSVKLPFTEKISVKPIPQLRAQWGMEAKAQQSTIFINNELWNKIDADYLLRICAHEGIPGHIIERHNANNILKKYKIKKKIKKYMKKGNLYSIEGWATYSETLINELYSSDHIMANLYCDLVNYCRIIVDTGLHSKNVSLRFTIKSAFNFMKKYTQQDTTLIYKEIIRILAKPGFYISYGLGKLLIQELFNNINLDSKTFNSLFMKIPLTIPLMNEFMIEAKSIKLN